MNFFEIKDIIEFSRSLDELILRLLEINVKECLDFHKTLSNLRDKIVHIMRYYNLNNGFIEGYNNKIKVIKIVSYGIKKFENLEKLIMLRIA